MPPPCSRAQLQARSVIAGMRSNSVVSNGSASEALRIRLDTAPSAASLRPDRISRAPASSKAKASAVPIPDDAPVTHQTLPSNISLTPFKPSGPTG